jgi:predicted Rossmann fold nucleotide-binding protein DprA/Smf involved in DNA uptake
MTDTVEQVRSAIQGRLADITDEAGRLERALEHLKPTRDGRRSPASRRGSSRRNARRRSSKRAPAGQRAEQFIDFVKENPNSKGISIAEELGVAPSQIYSLAKRLEKEGKVTKSKDGYKIKGPKGTRSSARKSPS